MLNFFWNHCFCGAMWVIPMLYNFIEVLVHITMIEGWRPSWLPIIINWNHNESLNTKYHLTNCLPISVPTSTNATSTNFTDLCNPNPCNKGRCYTHTFNNRHTYFRCTCPPGINGTSCERWWYWELFVLCFTALTLFNWNSLLAVWILMIFRTKGFTLTV